jgi:hypothetical protein
MAHSIPPPEELLEIRKTFPRAYEPWKDSELDELKQDWEKFMQKEQGMPEDYGGFVEWAVGHYGRNPGAITSRLSKIGAKNPARTLSKKKKSGIAHGSIYEIPVMDQNLQIKNALQILNNSNSNVFITGRAGTGKSTLLNYFRATTEKQVVVLAPTGVAALNVEGQTIHSFCGFPADITVGRVKQLKPYQPKRKLLQKLDTIIIDEISMTFWIVWINFCVLMVAVRTPHLGVTSLCLLGTFTSFHLWRPFRMILVLIYLENTLRHIFLMLTCLTKLIAV